MLVDTHAHLHFTKSEAADHFGYDDVAEVLARAYEQGVETIINVGVDPADSRRALALCQNPDFALAKTGVKMFASAGLHPHEASQGDRAIDLIADLAEDVVAIGECGLDYFKNHATKSEQEHVLRAQIELAQHFNLPLIFHVREAWAEFFAILADYPNTRGVVHSFTGTVAEVDKVLSISDELYFGLNGIMTFTRVDAQLMAARYIPANRLLLETDAPFLSPHPHRGKRNEPAMVSLTATFLADLRAQSVQSLADISTGNALRLFGLE